MTVFLAANNMSRQANQAILQAAKVGDASTVSTFLERLDRLYGGANPYFSDEVRFVSAGPLKSLRCRYNFVSARA